MNDAIVCGVAPPPSWTFVTSSDGRGRSWTKHPHLAVRGGRGLRVGYDKCRPGFRPSVIS